MKAPTVRCAPTRAAMTFSLSPFCSETTQPSSLSNGASAATAIGVSGALVQRKTVSNRPSRSAGVEAAASMWNSAIGPVIRSPFLFIAAT